MVNPTQTTTELEIGVTYDIDDLFNFSVSWSTFRIYKIDNLFVSFAGLGSGSLIEGHSDRYYLYPLPGPGLDQYANSAYIGDVTITVAPGYDYSTYLKLETVTGVPQGDGTTHWFEEDFKFDVVPASGGGNSPPKAVDDQATTGENQSVAINVLANDSDPESDPLSISFDPNSPSHGTIEIKPGSPGTIVYTPDPNFIGVDSFEYSITDGHSNTDQATVTVTTTDSNAYWVSDGGVISDFKLGETAYFVTGAPIDRVVFTDTGTHIEAIYYDEQLNPIAKLFFQNRFDLLSIRTDIFTTNGQSGIKITREKPPENPTVWDELSTNGPDVEQNTQSNAEIILGTAYDDFISYLSSPEGLLKGIKFIQKSAIIKNIIANNTSKNTVPFLNQTLQDLKESIGPVDNQLKTYLLYFRFQAIGEDILDGRYEDDAAGAVQAYTRAMLNFVPFGETAFKVSTVVGTEIANLIWGDSVTTNLAEFGDLKNSIDPVVGGKKNNAKKGGPGSDVFNLKKGNDKAKGKNGDDYFIDSDGNDKYIGGSGFDTVYYTSNQKSININLQKKQSKSKSGEKDKLKSIENAMGTVKNDVIVGDKNANTLYGYSGNDKIDGLDGDDYLVGELGNDKLNGGKGRDTLNGGVGSDTLTGGPGPDSFIFGPVGGGVDTVTDYSKAEGDLIVLLRGSFRELGANAGSEEFVVGTTALTHEQHLVFDPGTKTLFYDPDGLGGMAQTPIAVFKGGVSLTHDDFVLVW